ncbi:hypothetical protein CLM85_27225 [Streptomyces albidoflavus]|nr:hypothetical protein CLM81_08355 [Streptomyces albidoflavus]PAX90035.1 hypothetical protein CLM82_17805 [Streptomyces albidoflavus]PBO18998.1 hypothetical protein CLM83_09050 [Streptomyces albidoflavus]PBO21553.1 hypothetical protein CLM85_27225 [Streptomyces albidoflavus]PBO28992.1 hypothetical protein CLM84_16690 [Streptomyces albidoflavus]
MESTDTVNSTALTGQDTVVRAFARQMLGGRLTPQELAVRIHQRFGHQPPLAERLAELDEEYGNRTLAPLDAAVTAEARRLAHARPGWNRRS